MTMSRVPPRLLHVVGVRPNYVKASAVLRASEKLGRFRNVLVDTGQHYDPALRDAVLADVGLRRPDHSLGVGSDTHARQTASIMVAFEALVETTRADGVLVFGDVNSTLACALVAAKLGVPLFHVEAGLRNFDRRMPEEINRVLTDALADLLFTPSREADANLRREGIADERIRFVGNVMVDTLTESLPRARARDVVGRLGLTAARYALLTLHRPQNVDHEASLDRLVEAIAALQTDLTVVFPVHPRSHARLETSAAGTRLRALPNVRLIPPLGYLDFVCLQANARVVLTDSGGVQEETSVLGIPCVTLLDRTERPVTLTEGTNRLGGSEPAQIVEAVRAARAAAAIPATIEGWDGHAAERLVRGLDAYFS